MVGFDILVIGWVCYNDVFVCFGVIGRVIKDVLVFGFGIDEVLE